jgi:hypothetical protein
MFDHYLPATKPLVDAHRKKLFDDARKYRLVRQPGASRLGRRIRVGIGYLLVAIGQKLQEPYTLAISREAEAS